MTAIKDKSIQTYLDELASKAPTPGGGSVAALLGAQAAALTSMVCNITIGKPEYIAVEEAMQLALSKSENLRTSLTNMIKADIDAFEQLMATYALAKTTEQEKKLRGQKIQIALYQATRVPLACAKACTEVIKLSQEVADKGNVNVLSDAGVAVMLAYAGLKSAALNVYVNVENIQDRAFAQAQLAQLTALLKGADLTAEEIYQQVRNNY